MSSGDIDLRVGGACGIIGGISFAVVRLLHGDTPGSDAAASLDFVAGRPDYAAVHVVAVFAALLGAACMIGLYRSLSAPAAQMWAALGLAAAGVGLAIFGVESTSEGLALPELARASATVPAEQRVELVRAAKAVLAVTHGPSLVAIALLHGAALVAIGVAVVVDEYPSWLGWAGITSGAVTLAAAVGEYLRPDLVPGSLIYGVLASIVAQLWLTGLAVHMLGRSRPAEITASEGDRPTERSNGGNE